MVLLCSADDVLERLVDLRSGEKPKGLTQGRVEAVISGISGLLLKRMGLTAEPTDELTKDMLHEVAVQLAEVSIRITLAGKDTQAIEALTKRWDRVIGTVPLATKVEEVVGSASSSLSPTRQFSSFTEDVARVKL